MKYIFELNSRVTLEESAEVKHKKTIAFFKSLSSPWGIGGKDIPFPGFGESHVAQAVLDKYLGKGIRATIFYRYRNMLSDDDSCDDRIYFEFNVKKIDYTELIDKILPEFVKNFDAYRAIVVDQELLIADFEKSRLKNLRDTIIRFYPVCFFDGELCIKGLGITDKDAFRKLANDISVSEIAGRGLYIHNSSKFLTLEEANAFDAKVSKILKG